MIVRCSPASVGVREAGPSTGLKQDHDLIGQQIRASVVDDEYRIASTLAFGSVFACQPYESGKESMALQSQLFQGDPQLEAAAVSDSAHILPGAVGEHVRKIQLALIQLDNATIDADGKSGAHTSAAVLVYKTKRNIINRTYQTQADNIVGKLTMAALDREMLDAESASAGPIRIRPLFQVPRSGLAPPLVRPGGLLLGFKLNLDIPTTPSGANINLRLKPRSTETLEIVNGKGGIILCSTNSPSGSSNDKTCFLYDPTDANTTIRLNPEPLGIQDPREFGGQVKLVSEPQILKLDAFAPGDSMIVAANGKSPNTTATVLVRAPKLGVVAGAPPTKLRPADEKEKGRPASKFFSSRDSEPNPTGLNFDRPVNPKRTGRMINLEGNRKRRALRTIP